MFENFGAALIQLFGFLGVFAFFIYQLLIDKKNVEPNRSSAKEKDINSKKAVTSGFFGRRKKEVLVYPPKKKKNGWFQK